MRAPSLLPTDVLVLGGGPAGAIAATLLARRGLGVTVLDAATSRGEVGASLSPGLLPLLDELGVGEVVRTLPHTGRWDGVEFLAEDGEILGTLPFSEALEPGLPHGYQVHRGELDAALLNHARRSGAEVLRGWKAANPVWEGDRLVGVVAANSEGAERQILARAVLDATGQAALLASRMGWRFGYPRHRKVAVQQLWRLPRPLADGRPQFTSLVAHQGGWLWLAPLASEEVSLGGVFDPGAATSAQAAAQLLRAAVATTPAFHRLLQPATELAGAQFWRDYSYRVLRVAGDGYCLLGDAAGFFDPLGFLGVLTAAATAASGALDIAEGFARHGRVDAADFGPTIAFTRGLHRAAFALSRAFHDPLFRRLLLQPPHTLRLRAGLISLCAGDLLREGRWRRTWRLRVLHLLSRVHRYRRPWARGGMQAGRPTGGGGSR